MGEVINILISIVLALATIVLAISTAVLAVATIFLAKHTNSMNQREKKQKREQDIQRCIFLGELIVALDPNRFGNIFWELLTSEKIKPFTELLTLGKYFTDTDTKKDLEYIAYRLETQLGIDDIFGNDHDFINRVEKFRRDRLKQQIIDWQKQLGNYGSI